MLAATSPTAVGVKGVTASACRTDGSVSSPSQRKRVSRSANCSGDAIGQVDGKASADGGDPASAAGDAGPGADAEQAARKSAGRAPGRLRSFIGQHSWLRSRIKGRKRTAARGRSDGAVTSRVTLAGVQT